MSRLPSARRLGLTLLELVVVVGILAVLSTIAVRSMEPMADQVRYEQTQKLLTGIRSALVHCPEPGSSMPNHALTGFVLDTGTFPAILDDLLVRPVSLIDRNLQSFDSDRDTIDDVSLASGWGGPYLHLAAGVSQIVDGWGAAPAISLSLGQLTVTSMGADGDSIAPEDGYRADMAVTILPQDYQGTLVFRLFEIDSLNGSRIDPNPTGTQRLAVLFYGVHATGGSSGEVAEQFINISSVGSFEFRRNDTLAGSTAARAILWDDSNGNSQLDLGESIIKKSYVHYVTVWPRVETRLEMELR